MANLQVTVTTDYNGRGIKQAQADMQALDQKTIKQLQDRLKGLQQVLSNTRPNTAVFTKYATEVNKTTAALKALQDKSKNIGQPLATSMGGATSSVIEFNRVIQDAPYGIQGVGNNIQSLTQNFAYLMNETGSARKATSLFFSSLITPANLAVLAVSAITTAWTVYNSIQQKNKKSSEDAVKSQRDYNQELDDFVDTLGASDRASVRATQSTSEETTKLKILYGVTQDVTMGIAQRNRAADQLQSLYPEYFKNQTNENILAGDAADAYDRLSNSIKATGLARAAVDISAENSKQLVETALKRQSLDKKEIDLLDQKKKAQKDLNDAQKRSTAPVTTGAFGAQISSTSSDVLDAEKQLRAVENDLADLADERTKNGLKDIKLSQDQYNLQKLINEQLKKGADITGKPGSIAGGSPKTPARDIIKDALQDSADNTNSEGLKGAKKAIEDLDQEYAKYIRDIDTYTKNQKEKGINTQEEGEKAKLQLVKDYTDRRTTIETDEAQRVADEVQRIRNDSGVQTQDDINKELAAVVKWRDAEIAKAQGNSDILATIEEGSQARVAAIRQKYLDKYIEQIDKLTDKIKSVEEQGFTQSKTGSKTETDNINKELQKRIDKLNDLYDAMLKINKMGGLGEMVISTLKAQSISKVTDSANTARNSSDYQSGKAINAAIGKFTSDMYDSLANIGKKNTEITEKYNKAREGATAAEIATLNEMERQEKSLANSFGSIFSSIFDSFTHAMDNVFKQTLTNLLKTSFQKGLEGLNFGGLGGKISSAIVSGAALAGNAISSIGGGKSSVASGIGGALSGAASGAAIGSLAGPAGTVVGAVVGGLAGAISGIFGASKKRKEEQIQEQQLEEQRKTNALLDRQSRLAYSSQIIGRMSDRGVITAVDVNEFGQLTTTIAGSDIVVAYDRTKKNQSRGT